jgi:acyl-coenzyme A thioesterase PaaI-like protein
MPLTLAEIEARLLARPQPSAALFSRRILNLLPEDGRVEAEFDVPKAFAAPTGHVQGGFLAAILDDLAALAAIIHADQPIIVPTLTFTVNFLASANV